MSIRKIAGLVAAFALTVGLIGAGVSAAFTAQVTAVENVSVGTFGCTISSQQGTLLGDTVTYTVPTIMSSAAGSAPFAFTVTSTGTIPVLVHVSVTVPPSAPFTDILGAPADVTLAQNAAHTYNGGLQWPELFIAQQGMSTSITYTATCGEVPARTAPTIAVVCPQVPGQDNSTEFNWYVSLHGVEPNYNMDFSTNGTDWNGPIDWSDQNDPLAGGGWGGPITTTSFADNGGNNLWVRWSSDPGSKVGPVSNVCP